jgi:hypothetical protein
MNSKKNHFSTIDLSFYQKSFLVIAIIFSIFVFIEAIRYLKRNDAVDLGFRITGTRLLVNNKSPYLYFWKEGDNPKFYNRYEPRQGSVNRVTVPPSVLILTIPFASLETTTIKWIWMFLSYGLALGSIFLFYKLSEDRFKNIILAFSVFFFLGSMSWLLHIERGQVYVVYLFMLSLIFYCFKKEKIILALGVLCLLVWMRAPFIFFFLPFLSSLKKPKTILWLFLYLLILGSITLLFSSSQNWQDYFFAMTEWSKVQVIQPELFSDSTSDAWKYIAENIKDERDYIISNSSIQYLFQYHLKIGLFKTELLIFFIVSTFFIVVPIQKVLRKNNTETLFLAAFLIYISFELFIPAPRYNYNFIQWMFPLLLLFVSDNEIKPYQWMLIILGLLINMGLFIYIPRAMIMGESLLFLTIWLVLLRKKSEMI